MSGIFLSTQGYNSSSILYTTATAKSSCPSSPGFGCCRRCTACGSFGHGRTAADLRACTTPTSFRSSPKPTIGRVPLLGDISTGHTVPHHSYILLATDGQSLPIGKGPRTCPASAASRHSGVTLQCRTVLHAALRHSSSPAPTTFARRVAAGPFCAVPQGCGAAADGSLYGGPFHVLERSTYYFFLQVGDRLDKVSTLHLKPAHTPANTEPAKPLRRCHPADLSAARNSPGRCPSCSTC